MPAPTGKSSYDARRRAEEARQKYAQQQAASVAAARARQRAAQQSRFQAEQQARIGEQRRREQAASVAAAQARRAQAEQQARIGEQQRKSADEARQKALTQRRISRHTVKAGDTPESIAATYGADPRQVAGLVPRLRPGQRIDVPSEVPVEGVAAVKPAVVAPTMPMGQYLVNQGIKAFPGMMPTVAGLLNKFFKESQTPGPLDFGGLPQGQLDYAAAGEQLTQEYLDAGPEGIKTNEWYQAVGEPTPRANLAQYNKARRVPGGIHDQIEKEQELAKFDRGNFANMMRYTGQALAYAWEAKENGDPNWMDYISRHMPGDPMDGQVTMYLTDGRWDSGPMKEQFSVDAWNKIKSLGFTEVEDGLWMMPILEPPDYGMGGYDFPGYGGGYGGGGGDYKYLSRGGEMRRKVGGGDSIGERYRIFPEGVSPAHWRI